MGAYRLSFVMERLLTMLTVPMLAVRVGGGCCCFNGVRDVASIPFRSFSREHRSRASDNPRRIQLAALFAELLDWCCSCAASITLLCFSRKDSRLSASQLNEGGLD